MAIKPNLVDAPDINLVIKERGPEFALGMDVPRVWATGAQAWVDPHHTLLVFREQAITQSAEGGLTPVLKNVASLVMPTDITRELHRILGEQLEILDGKQAQQPE